MRWTRLKSRLGGLPAVGLAPGFRLLKIDYEFFKGSIIMFITADPREAKRRGEKGAEKGRDQKTESRETEDTGSPFNPSTMKFCKVCKCSKDSR